MSIKYSICGHETSGIIIMDSNPLSISAYMSWNEEGHLDNQDVCFPCWLNKVGGAK